MVTPPHYVILRKRRFLEQHFGACFSAFHLAFPYRMVGFYSLWKTLRSFFLENFKWSFHNKNHKMSTTTTVGQHNELCILNASDDNLLQKLQSKFTEEDQELFVQSFIMYLNHDQENDFVIDMDNIWEWLGFARKENCKRVLKKHFIKDVHYKIALLQPAERKNEGGFNKETITMNIKTFKKLCVKADTKKANDVHHYYIKMEEALHEFIVENAYRQSKLEREKTLIQSFDTRSVNYFGTIGKIDGVDMGKFGWSNNVGGRIEDHKKSLVKILF